MNGWFPQFNKHGDILSGDTEIWLTHQTDGIITSQEKLVEHGTKPIWLTPNTFIYNDRNGRTKSYPPEVDTIAYNELSSNQNGLWSGFHAVNDGFLDNYKNSNLQSTVAKGSQAKYDQDKLAYLTPYQDEYKHLIIDNKEVYSDRIVDYIPNPLIVVVATGTYTRQFVGAPIINPTENRPVYSDGWLCTNAGDAEGLYLRPYDSLTGYFLAGSDWFYHDFIKIGESLIVAASTSSGDLRIKCIRTSEPRVYLADKQPGPIIPEKPVTPQEYMKQYNLPSLDHWIHVEFPQLLAAYTEAQGHAPEPDFEWAAFQTYRRYMEPDVWTFEKMLEWEKNGGKPPVNPQ